MVARFREYARRHGIRKALIEVASRLRALVYSTHRITLVRKDLSVIKAPSKQVDLRVGDLDAGALAGLAALNRERGRSNLDRDFRRNVERDIGGFVGRIGGEIVAYCWWVDADRAGVHSDFSWLAPALRMRPSEVYGSDLYMLPRHRGRGTAEAMLFGVETGLRERGFEAMWGYIDAGNMAARWTYAARGYASTEDLLVRKLFGHRKVVPIEKERGS